MDKMSLLRIVASSLFSMATGVFVGMHYMTADQAAQILADLKVIIPALGSLATIGASIYANLGMKKVPVWSTALDISPAVMPAPGKTASNITAKVVGALLAGFLVMQAPRAFAADLPVAAPVDPNANGLNPCLPISCSGFYVGGNLIGVATNANIIGNGVNGSVAAGGQSIGGQGGYQFANGSWFWAAEVSADYTVNGNPNVTGGSPPKYLFGEHVKIGTSLANLLGLVMPATGTPNVPSALASKVISPYLLFGAAQRSWGTGWQSGAGVEFALTKNWFADVRYSYINYGNATISPTQSSNAENLVTVAVNYKF